MLLPRMPRDAPPQLAAFVSYEAAQVSSVPLKQWAAGLVQEFHDLIASLCSSMTQYLIIHQRSLYNHSPAGLLRTLGKDFCIARRGLRVANFIEDYRKRYHLFRKCALQSCCDLAYAVANRAISCHMDHMLNMRNHVTFRTHFNGSIISSLLLFTLDSNANSCTPVTLVWAKLSNQINKSLSLYPSCKLGSLPLCRTK